MKKSKIVTLALVSSLTIISCSEKKEPEDQRGFTVHGWSNSNDTVQSARVYHGGGFYPFFIHYGAFGMYSQGNYHEASRVVNRGGSSKPSFHSITSPSSRSSFSSRGGFGHISAGRSSVS
jgi:uncharacterized protein YgiB involved in biofilm formation